jgi:adenylosuccinate lyase
VILPDSTILIDYMLALAVRVVRELRVDAERMRENLELTYGALYSQRVLLALVEGGMERDEAYRLVQSAAQRAWDERTPLRELLAAVPAAAALDLDELLDATWYVRHADEIVARLDEIAPSA